ncbi:pyridoxal phosphate-dependent decarboxylase family protein [Geoglobus ahangari]
MTHVLELLAEIEKQDLNPYTGRLFAYVYETGDEELKRVAKEALLRFYDKNILDFTVFRSAIYFEKKLVSFCRGLMNAGEGVVGSYTYGGTESIMLAVKAARNHFRKEHGSSEVPELVVPVTIHPSFYKAAHYLGLRVRRIGIGENRKADVEELKEAVGGKTALIALSAPNWPYGTVDPVGDVAEIASDSGTLLHVDACLGGFALPFFEKIGESIPKFDFRVDGVTSISMDAHKYGYSPKGASVVLFRNEELKKHSMYVDVTSPGYIFVNTAVLSTRSVGPLAAAWAVMKYLGEDGYVELAKKILSARRKMLRGLEDLGFKPIAPVESMVLTMSSEKVDLLGFVTAMREKGWHFHLQKGLLEYGVPPNIHMTLSPIHDQVADEFLEDAERCVGERSGISLESMMELAQRGDLSSILRDFEEGRIDSSIVPMLLEGIPAEIAEEIVKQIVVGWYS